MKDELELAITDVNTSGLLSHGMLGELKNNEAVTAHLSGRFYSITNLDTVPVKQAATRK